MGMEARVMSAVKPYPLTFVPQVLEKVWGGRRLERLGRRLPKSGAGYGESWEIADLGATNASGAGGGAVRSVVASGELKGLCVGDAIGRFEAGEEEAAAGFPLLIKYLDAREDLSVQVHPSAAMAKRDAGAHLKTESWYVVEAEPGANLYIGLKKGVTRGEFERALGAGDAQTEGRHPVVELMERVDAVPGRCHTLPSGIVHALGAGVLVAEVQTPSDTTYRLFDWGRKGREMHIDAGLASAFDDAGEPSVREAPVAGPMEEGELCARLAETEYYTIDEVRPLAGDEATVGFPCRCGGKRGVSGGEEHGFVLMTVGGTGELVSADGAFEPVRLGIGATVYVPRPCARESVLRGGAGLRVLRVGVLGAAAGEG
jgi:mannose-6-phosphate isomerase